MKLDGVRVLDLGMFLPGPVSVAGHGRPRRRRDQGRAARRRRSRAGTSGSRSATAIPSSSAISIAASAACALNLKAAAGREALLRVAATADVFLEAFRPGVTERLGCDYAAVRARNPRIVYCSISAFGREGPYRDKPAHDLVCEAYAGLVSLGAGSAGQPTLPPVPVADLAAATMALAGVVMALYRREKTGVGDYLDISMHDCALACLPNVLGPVFVEKRDLVLRDERSLGGAAFYQVYATRDGRHVVLGAQEPKFVRALLNEWQRPDLIEPCLRGPGPHQRPVIDFLQGMFATRTQAEWIAWFEGRDIGFGPVKTLREAFDDQPRERTRHAPARCRGRRAHRPAAPVRGGARPPAFHLAGARRADDRGPARSGLRRCRDRGDRRARSIYAGGDGARRNGALNGSYACATRSSVGSPYGRATS